VVQVVPKVVPHMVMALRVMSVALVAVVVLVRLVVQLRMVLAATENYGSTEHGMRLAAAAHIVWLEPVAVAVT
jgi:hypothetical protein